MTRRLGSDARTPPSEAVMLAGSIVSSRKDHHARQPMKIKNCREIVSLQFRAGVRSVYFHAQGVPTDMLRVESRRCDYAHAPHEIRGTSRCVRELTDPRSPAAWKIDRCYRASRD